LISVFVEIPRHHCSRSVTFLVDSGATNSILIEPDASLMGLDCSIFPDCKQLSVGFGGTFRNKVINCPVRLTFGSDKQKYILPFDSGLSLMIIPPHLSAQDKEIILRSTKSVIGMDILRHFKTYIDKNKVELTIDDP